MGGVNDTFSLTTIAAPPVYSNPNTGGGGNSNPNTGGGQNNPPKTVLSTLLSLSANQKAIKAGNFALIKGQLKDTSGNPVAGKEVIIKQKVLKKKKKKVKGKIKVIKKWTWKKLAVVKTDTNGNFTLKVKPKQTTTYMAEFAGDSGYSAKSSNVVKLTVKKSKNKKK